MLVKCHISSPSVLPTYRPLCTVDVQVFVVTSLRATNGSKNVVRWISYQQMRSRSFIKLFALNFPFKAQLAPNTWRYRTQYHGKNPFPTLTLQLLWGEQIISVIHKCYGFDSVKVPWLHYIAGYQLYTFCKRSVINSRVFLKINSLRNTCTCH